MVGVATPSVTRKFPLSRKKKDHRRESYGQKYKRMKMEDGETGSSTAAERECDNNSQ